MTARALVVQHTTTEGTGWLGEWLPAAGVELEVVRPHTGQPLPARLTDDALIVLGGPMGAYDDAAAPWLPATRDLLRQAVADATPVLGVCLGGQLLAAACGGRVERGPGGETGIGEVRLRSAAEDDPLLSGLPPVVPVLQWHFDAITALPPAAVWLAESAAYRHQAFRLGDRAWGVQFHVEAPATLVASWARSDAGQLTAAGLDVAAVVEGVRTSQPALVATWRPVVERWAGLVLAGSRGADATSAGRWTGRE